MALDPISGGPIDVTYTRINAAISQLNRSVLDINGLFGTTAQQTVTIGQIQSLASQLSDLLQATASGLRDGLAQTSADLVSAKATLGAQLVDTAAGLRAGITQQATDLANTRADLGAQVSSVVGAETNQRIAQYTVLIQSLSDIRDALTAYQTAADGRLDGLDAGAADFLSRLTALLAQLAVLAGRRYEYLPAADRPGDAPARFTVVSTAAALGGPRAALPEVPSQLLAIGDSGAVVRFTGVGILACRSAYALELGRLYRLRIALQRRTNPADPSGDAVVLGGVYLDQSLRVLSGVSELYRFENLRVGNARQEREMYVSRSSTQPGFFSPPDAARFFVPVVQFFGPDHVTDVEVVAFTDVTDNVVNAPNVADFEARLAAIEAGMYGDRVQVLEGAVGTPSKVTFKTRGDAVSGTIPATVQVVELLGRNAVGDGGHGLFLRTADTPPAGSDSITSSGAVFVRIVPAADVVSGMLAAGLPTYAAGLPTVTPTEPRVAYINGNAIEVTR